MTIEDAQKLRELVMSEEDALATIQRAQALWESHPMPADLFEAALRMAVNQGLLTFDPDSKILRVS